MNAATSQTVSVAASPHPNELDRRRIERAIANRKRYKYVTPSVHSIDDGYCVRSPCCSRKIDPDGGVVDVAIVQYGQGAPPWGLYRKDHSAGEWWLYAKFERLGELLEQLNADPQRAFWQ